MKIIKGQSTGHITPFKVYLTVILTLFVLTILTVFTAKSEAINCGLAGISESAPIILAMFIASIKGSLVVMYFMHGKHESNLVRGYGLYFPLVLVAILVVMIGTDVWTRADDAAPDKHTNMYKSSESKCAAYFGIEGAKKKAH